MQTKGLKHKLIVIALLVLVLPYSLLLYYVYEQGVPLAPSPLALLAVILSLLVAGFVLLHRLLGEVAATAKDLAKASESGEKLRSDPLRRLKELNDISDAFNRLMERCEKTAADLTQRVFELNALREFTEVSGRMQNVEDILQHLVLDKAMVVTRALVGSVFILDPACGCLRMVAARGFKDPVQDCAVDIDGSLMKPVVTDKKPLIVQNIEEDPRTRKTNDPRYGSPSFMSMPILMGNDLFAVLNLASKERDHVFDANDERVLSIMLDEIGVALEKAHLHASVESHLKKMQEREAILGQECADRQQAAEQWKRYKFIVDITKRFLTLINRNYLYEAASEAFCRAHNLTPEDVIGRSVSDIWGQKVFEDIIKSYLDRCLSGEEFTYDECFEFPALGLQYFSVSYWPYRNNEGVITHAVVFTQNITERKKLESQLLQAQKLEAVGTLAGGIAHDFNNLLMTIQGYTSLIMIGMDSGDPDYERMKAIESQVIAGANLTRQLLGFARGGRYEVKPLNLNEILERTSTMFGRTKKQLQIHKNFQQNLWPVEVDLNQIEQVLLNLYLNAWQAMPGGGQLSLETTNSLIGEDDRKTSYMKPGKYVKLAISDTGMGMDEKTRKRIFEPFFTTKGMGRGTGLGLASVYGIIQGHKGFIEVESEEGRGTIFTLYFPASDKSVVPEERQQESLMKGRGTILIVDDEEAIVKVMNEILEILGYQVLVAEGGREALKVYAESVDRIDLVILDMVMPEMSGGETFDALKRINPRLKVILSSGYSLNSEAAAIMARGCQGFLQKPASMEMLSQKIRDVLGA